MTSRSRKPKTAVRRGRKGTKRSSRRGLLRGLAVFLFKGLAALALLVVPTVVVYLIYLDYSVQVGFEGRRWALPARVYARPLELYAGRRIDAKQLSAELRGLYYREDTRVARPGTFAREGDGFLLHTRSFRFSDGSEEARKVRVRLAQGRVHSLRSHPEGAAVALLRLDSRLVGSIYPKHNQDRILVNLEETPPLLVQTLLAVEDRRFYTHKGVAPRAMLRALWVNIRAGGIVQGGSTLTQQLVKNIYLGPQRNLWRKLKEAAMALLLEWRYSKDEILEVYLNEIYLGQDGRRAIHGFGLASQFYFARPLDQLLPAEIALLVGLVRGPSYYNPRRHPQRAEGRRNLVLGVLVEQGAMSAEKAAQAARTALRVVDDPPGGTSPYPAFLDLVRRQLTRDYRPGDLSSAGLRIFTTLDPWVQDAADHALRVRVAAEEQNRSLPEGKLQGAVAVTARESGEVLALSGGHDPRHSSFNRALDAVRPIGSLVKPAVFLTALSRPQEYSLLTRLDDRPLQLRDGRGEIWSPQNFDRRAHGEVTLKSALAHSYNLSTVRLGLAVGMRSVVDTLHALGVRRELAPYPSLLLGAAALTPLETVQLYQTIADEGFHKPLRAIRAVLDVQGRPLDRYPLSVRQVADGTAVYLLTTALQAAVDEGTGKGLSRYLPGRLRVAGKTGTTDGFRDSWFAGFTGSHVGVVWMGADDNSPTGLTGASGALKVWGEIMARAHPEPLSPSVPENVVWLDVDPQSGLLADDGCDDTVQYPFAAGSEPKRMAPCAGRAWSNRTEQAREWVWGLFK